MSATFRSRAIGTLAVGLTLFTLLEVNYPQLTPQTQLAIFAWLGIALGFLTMPLAERWRDRTSLRWLDVALALLMAFPCGWVVVQTEPAFASLWQGGISLGDRAGAETGLDLVAGLVGLVLVLEVTRRAVGWALPLLSLAFVAYAWFGRSLPDWLFPHRGYPVERIVAQSFLHSQGVFGIALNVMFTYVFLFVVLGALLELTGATRFVIDGARKLLHRSVGGPAKVAVLSSGLMGSLSGSAVANTATTGTFTIPLMRSSGFRRHVAAGVEAAASSGGALVPPVMGAGAYMMLEIVDPPVTYVQIIKAALIPAILYYLSLFLIVHFTALRIEARRAAIAAGETSRDERDAELDVEEIAPGQAGYSPRLSGLLFFASLGSLLVLLFAGYTVFRSVTVAMAVVVVLSLFDANIRLGPARMLAALKRAAGASVPLVAAAACVGIVIGVVTLTGIGTRLPSVILPMAENSLLGALALLMVSSIILGMGLPSAVCYLLMATLVGPVLGNLGVVPLAAHLFIFYFGMMSMVTPPVALAGYTAASIAGASIMRSSFAAFRFALVGFTLPYMFVLRPALLLLDADGGSARPAAVASAVAVAVLGILALAATIAGHLRGELALWQRGLLLVSALLLLQPAGPWLPFVPGVSWWDAAGMVLLAVMVAIPPRRTVRVST